MSQKTAAAPTAPAPPAAPTRPYAPPRPTIFDYLFILFGFSLSLYLVRIDPLPAKAADWVQNPYRESFVPLLPDLMRLPEGAILMWPVFLLLQRLRWRKKGLTSVEWLWILSWLGVAFLAGLAVWNASQGIPDNLKAPDAVRLAAPRLWYLIFVPTMAALGVLLWFFSLFAREPAPWTHSFGLALLLWPLLPLAGVLTLGEFVPR
jgi:hypothetical protein